MIKPLALLFLVLVLFPFDSTACDHDDQNHTIRTLPRSLSDPSKDRTLASGAIENIRISAFYYLDNINTARIKTTISEQIMPAAISYYQAALKVKRPSGAIAVSDDEAGWCAEVGGQAALRNGVDTDLILFVTAYRDTASTTIASARACFTDGDTNRPVVGHIKFNIAIGFSDDTEYNFQEQLYTTLHEMGHVLGFSAGLYENYINPNTNVKLGIENVIKSKTVNGVTVNMIVVEPLRTRLRNYFDCQTLEGAYIEQQGGTGSAGSHFERRIFMNEFMTASSTIDSRVSEFFLALLEGTGWYFPEYSMAEPMLWGKGQKCDFLNTKCLNTNKQTSFPSHFCTTLNVDSCTFTNAAYAVCGAASIRRDSTLLSAYNYFGDNTVVMDGFADNCPYYYSYSNAECKDASNPARNLPGGEYFGSESSCFTGTLSTYTRTRSAPFCLKSTCQQVSSGVYNILIKIGSASATCTQEGTISVSGYSGTLNCPNPNTFCSTVAASYCPRGCMGQGACINGECVCNAGYSGSDCAYHGEISFSEQKSIYVSSPEDISGTTTISSSNNKIIIYAIAGAAGGVVVLATVAYVVTRMRRAKARKEAARKKAERKSKRAAASGANGAPAQSNRARKSVDMQGINIDIGAQQPTQMNQMQMQLHQQFYANQMNPNIQMQMQMQNNQGVYYAANNAPQGRRPSQHVQQGHVVRIPNS